MFGRLPVVAILGIVIGILLFASPALLLGEHHASLVWLLGWAMFWSPSFCALEDDRPGYSQTHFT